MATTELRTMSSFLSRRLQQRWQARHTLLIWLLACTLSCVMARGENDVGVSTMRRHLQQLPIASVDGPSTSEQQEARELNIFGKDGRQQVSDPNAYPYSAVGLLRWNDDVTCTATLVASNIIVTAAECVLDSNGNLRDTSASSSSFSFPQTTEIQTASVTRVHKQSDFWTKWTQNTYVLVELDVDLGTTIGALHLPTASTFAEDAPMNVQLVDFGNNEEAGECFQLCEIHFPSEFDGPEYMVHHDCDVSAKRSPGSPMLIRSTNLDTYIIGIHTNAIGDNKLEDKSTETYLSYNDTVANRGVLGSFIQPHLSYLVQRAESSLDTSTSPEDNQKSGSERSISSSNSFIADPASNNHPNNQGNGDQADAGPSAALAPSSASSSSAETSVGASHLDIAGTAAYTCIGLVCASWLAIIFVAARRIRSNR